MKKLFITMIFSASPLIAFSQNDTLVKANENCNKYSAILEEDQKKEVKQLWKMNLIGFAPTIPNCGLELKLGKNWSSDTYLKAGLAPQFKNDSNYNSFNVLGVIEISEQIKYYYNFKKRERLGKTINGFSGNYFSLNLFVKGNDYEYRNPLKDSLSSTVSEIFIYGAGINYGLQRRIGNIGYFEIIAGVKYIFKEVPEEFVYTRTGSYNGKDTYTSEVKKSTTRQLIPAITIRAGFALDSRSNLTRRTIK